MSRTARLALSIAILGIAATPAFAQRGGMGGGGFGGHGGVGGMGGGFAGARAGGFGGAGLAAGRGFAGAGVAVGRPGAGYVVGRGLTGAGVGFVPAGAAFAGARFRAGAPTVGADGLGPTAILAPGARVTQAPFARNVTVRGPGNLRYGAVRWDGRRWVGGWGPGHRPPIGSNRRWWWGPAVGWASYPYWSGYDTGYYEPAGYGGYGGVCQTPVTACTLYNPAPAGFSCSCRVPGGRSFGEVVP